MVRTDQNHTLLFHAAHSLPVPVDVHVVTVEADAVGRNLGISVLATQLFCGIDPALSSQPGENRKATATN